MEMGTGRVLAASLALSALALVGIVQQEGYTDHAVVPVPGDVPTIGFGTTDGVQMGDKITPPVALGRALRDIHKFEGALKRCVSVPLYQYEYDAWVSFAYNVGSKAFCNSTAVQKLNSGDYAGACAEMSRWTRVQGRVVPGLVNRRAAERAQCEGRRDN